MHMSRLLLTPLLNYSVYATLIFIRYKGNVIVSTPLFTDHTDAKILH